MNICYLDFWPGFNSELNWFSLLFKHLYSERNFNFNSSPEEADIIFASCFGNDKYKIKSNAIKLFYTGENLRPDLNFADYSLSFDFDTYNDRNFRLPHWFLYVNWWNDPNKDIAKISLNDLFSKIDSNEIWNRKNFCCIMIGNPVENRIQVAMKLNEYREVHGYGKVFGNYVSGNKIDVLKQYRFNICFENAIYPGYITEKLLEAKVAGCVPIYYGDDTFSTDFNKNCAINYKDFNNINDLYKEIKSLDENEEYFKQVVSEPLFKKFPDLDGLYEFLRKILE